MSNINKQNYEEFVLDFLEGNLSSAMNQEMVDFLDRHPLINQEVFEFENITIPKLENITYPHKESLLRESPKSYRKLGFYTMSSIAACLLISFGFFHFFNESENSVLSNDEYLQAITIESNTFTSSDKTTNAKEQYDEISKSKTNDSTNTTTSNLIQKENNARTNYKIIQKKKTSQSKSIINNYFASETNTAAEDKLKSKNNEHSIFNQNAITQKARNSTEIFKPTKSTELRESIVAESNHTEHRSIEKQKEVKKNITPLSKIQNLELAELLTKSDRKNDYAINSTFSNTQPVKDDLRIFGKFAFSNVTVSLIPSYLEKK